MTSEFGLIEQYFSAGGTRRDDVAVGIGDDCALLRPRAGMELAVTTDTLVEGRHFLPDMDPRDLGYKSLAVSLSDLAATGAEPAWATLALTLPEADAAWLGAFSEGLLALAAEHGVQLVGGDTTRGPLSVTVQLTGYVPQGQALRRNGARPGDLVYVTGTPGDAGVALIFQQRGYKPPPGYGDRLKACLNRPVPRVAAGMALRGIASAAVDISDGLGADLGHVLTASGAGATLELDTLPRSDLMQAYIERTGDTSLMLSAGDAYELCLTVPAQRQADFERVSAGLDCRMTWIGMIDAAPGLRGREADGELVELAMQGYDHFSGDA